MNPDTGDWRCTGGKVCRPVTKAPLRPALTSLRRSLSINQVRAASYLRLPLLGKAAQLINQPCLVPPANLHLRMDILTPGTRFRLHRRDRLQANHRSLPSLKPRIQHRLSHPHLVIPSHPHTARARVLTRHRIFLRRRLYRLLASPRHRFNRKAKVNVWHPLSHHHLASHQILPIVKARATARRRMFLPPASQISHHNRGA